MQNLLNNFLEVSDEIEVDWTLACLNTFDVVFNTYWKTIKGTNLKK